MTDSTAEDARPIADVLRNLEVELLHAGNLLAHLQVTLSPLLQTAASTSELRRDVQSLDLVTQQIQELAIVMNNLSSVAAPEWLVGSKDVVAALSLQALSNRICGRTMAKIVESYDGVEML